MKSQQKSLAISLLVSGANCGIHHDQLAGLERSGVRRYDYETPDARRPRDEGQWVDIAAWVAVLEDFIAVADNAGLERPDEGTSMRERQGGSGLGDDSSWGIRGVELEGLVGWGE